MFTILLMLFVFAGVSLIALGIRFKIIKTAVAMERKNINFLIDKLIERRFIKPFLNLLSRNKEMLPNKLALKLLELGESGISLQKLYFIKISCIIISASILTAVGFTNAAYERKMIIGSDNYAAKGFDEERYSLFNKVLEDVNSSKRYSDGSPLNLIISEKMVKYLNTTDKKLIKEYTDWFLEKWRKVAKIKIFNVYHIWILIFSFYIPEIILFLRWLLRGCVYKKEIIKLEYIFELLSRIDGIKTIDIIYQLEKSSKIYSPYLNEFSKIFKYDKRKGFKYLRNKNIKSLSKLAEIIEIYSLSDKEIAMQILEREVMERDEAMIITSEETMDFIDLAAFLSIIPLIYELVMLMLRPMLDVVYKAFEYI